jgi:PAS domain S-box-containing protein
MPTSTGWKVVVIDDEEDIRDVMSMALKDSGYDVIAAEDGQTGLRICEKISPQIVITDIRMPGMDGLQVLEALKKENADVEVIVATAFGEMDIAIQALQLDASDFITKPIGNDTLHLALNRAKARFTSKKQLKDYTSLLEREKAETSRELLKTITFQRNLIEGSMDGILGCDENKKIIIFNRSMQNMLGYRKHEVVHRMTFTDFFSPTDHMNFKVEFENEQHGGRNKLLLYETALKAKSGRRVPVQVSATALLDRDQVTGLVCFFRDLREIRKLEREMEDQARILHQDKMMSLGKLAASVVHEINNPLSGILNYVRLMLRILDKGQPDEERVNKFQRYLELVENETDRCSHIVSSLLNFSRMAPPVFGEVQIEELVNRCILLSRHKLELSHIRFESDIQAGIPAAKGDFNQLQQCMINLIFNAIDAMPEGGILTLQGHHDSEKGMAVVTIKDTGQGIAADDLPYIFEPFFTTKNQAYGVGLGLSTVYGIMERHNGSVEVSSQPGCGTVFKLNVPVF